MNITTLASTIQSKFVTGDTLAIPASGAQQQLASTDIASLITTYLSGTLTMTEIGEPEIGNTTIIYSGKVSFLDEDFEAQAIFYLVNSATDGTPELTLALALPEDWTFSETYPPLKDQPIDTLTFAKPNFVLESYTADGSGTFANLGKGLNFSGTLQPSSSLLEPVNWLLGLNLALTGVLTNWSDPKNTAPTMTLTTPKENTSLTLGSVLLATWIQADSKYTSGTLATSVALKGSVAIGGNTTLILTMLLEDDPDLVTFSLDTNTLLSSLADLTGLSNGASLSNMIPPQYPLSQILSLDEFTITVAPSLKQIVNLSFGIKLLQPSTQTLTETVSFALAPAPAPARFSSFSRVVGPPRALLTAGEPSDVVSFSSTSLAAADNADDALSGTTSPTWVIVPNFISINDIFVRFLILDPLNFRLSNLTVNIGATFWIGELYPIAVTIALPDVTVKAFLLPGYTIPLADLMSNFGFTPPPGFELDVTELQMTANPNYKTFDLSVALDGDVTLISLNNGNFNLTLTRITVEIELSQTGFSGTFVAYSTFAQVVDFYISAQKPSGDSSGWVFSAAITQPFSVGDLINNVTGWSPPSFVYDMSVTVFALTYNTGDSSFSLDAGFQWLFSDLSIEIDLLFHLESSVSETTKKQVYKGSIQGDFSFMGLKLTFIYKFDQSNQTTTYILMFGPVIATFANPNADGDKVLQINFGNTTLGDILTFLIKLADPGASSKLSAPWDALNAINLSNLSLLVNFTKNYIEIDYKGTFDLGFIKISNIKLRYTKNYGSGQVQISLEGEFLGQPFGKDNPLTWDAMNGQPPAVPGAGTKLLDLQYVGVGQHVSLDVTGLTSVTQVINALEKTVVPLTNTSQNPLEQVGGLQFDSTTNWLVGAKFVILDTFGLSIVFMDPQVYGLLINVAGPKAGIFQGLSFEIIYRKVTDTIGVYHIELKLPDAMRHLQFGSVSITLPVVIIDIYTNGNFRINFGFPANAQDFSNSFGLQIFPFIGYGGFYFALLDGATSTSVPQISNGSFSPVIEFGFALSVGVGKTITIGPLSAGVSVTVVGILQGVFAWFHPSDASTEKGLYYWLQGTIAVVGNIYGTVDFVVVKANLSLTVYASITLTIEAYKPIIIHMQAGVEVKISVKILFITLHFSFKATISLTFTIGSASQPPWKVIEQPAQRSLQMRSQVSLYNPAPKQSALLLPQADQGLSMPRPVSFSMTASAVAATASDPPLALMLTPVISQALPTDFLTNPGGSAPLPTCNLMLLINNAIPSEAQNAEQAKVPVTDAAQTPFNILLGKLLQWAIQFIGKEAGDTVYASELEAIHEQLDDPKVIAQIFAYPNLTNFFTSFNVVFEVDLRPTTQPTNGNISASFFPMFPELDLKLGNGVTHFWSDPPVDNDYVTGLTAYFQQLMVDYENSVQQDPKQTGTNARQPKTLANDDDSPTSMAGYLFSSYFAMLTKSVVQNAQDYLSQVVYEVTDAATTSLQTIAGSYESAPGDYVAQLGDTQASIAAQFSLPVESVARANASLADDEPIAPGTRVTVPVSVTPQSIVTSNQSTQGIFTTGDVAATPVQLTDLVYQIKSGDTFNSIAEAFSFPNVTPITAMQLITANADNARLLAVGTSFNLPTLNYTGKTGDTVDNVAQYFGVAATQVAQQGMQFTITGATYKVTGGLVVLYTWKQGDTLDSVINYFFAPSSVDLPSYEQLLQSWNLNVDFATAQPGTQIQIPYSETLTNLSRYYFPNTASDQQLSTLAPIIQAQAILSPLATLTISAVNYQPLADDSFSSIAQKFNLTLDELTEQISAQVNLFPNNTKLNVPNVPAIKVTDLVTGLSTSSLTNSAAATTSRFLLQGLRLPYPEMTDQTYPLYSLTKQAFPVVPAPASITLEIARTAPWIQFAGGEPLDVTFSTEEQAQITAFETLVFDPQVSWIGRLPLYGYQPRHFTVQNPLHWQAAALPANASFAPSGQAVAEPTVWDLPVTLSNQIAGASGASLFYDLAVSTYVDSTSGLQTSTVANYAWATLVDITVQQIPAPDGSAMKNSYLLIGADDVGKQTLYDLLNYLNNGGSSDGAQLYLLYTPDPAGNNPKGLASDQLDTTNTFLLKTNLSTLSHSGAQRTSFAFAEPQATASQYSATLADATNFLSLVWEASVVKSGGFYLQYTNSGKGSLPGYLFAQGTEATLTLLVLLNSQIKTSGANLQAFNNVAIVGDNIDSSRSQVFAEPITYKVQSGDTLQSIANGLSSYGMNVTSLALANQTILGLLKPGQKLQINATTPYTIQYADTFASIAQAHQPATVASIATASATLDIFTPTALMQLSGAQTYVTQSGDTLGKIVGQLNVPGLDVAALANANQNNLEFLQPGKTLNLTATTTYVIQVGDTLASIARAHAPSTVASIAVASQGLAILATTALAFYGQQQLEMQAAVPPGNIGFQLWRSYLASDPNQQQLNQLFNLLGFSIEQNAYFNASNEGLPAGPERDPGAAQAASNGEDTNDDDGILYYKQILAVYKSANATYNTVPVTPALPAPNGFPYAGIFANPTANQYSQVQIDLEFHDLSGNLTNATTPPTLAPMPVGYTDDLIGLAQWPSATAAFDFPAGKPELQIGLTFSTAKYLPSAGQSYETSHGSALTDCATYTSLYYQLQEPGLAQFAATTSVGEVDTSLAARQQLQLSLLGFVNQAYLFLTAAQALKQSFPPIAQGTQLGAIATQYNVGVADIMTANQNVELLNQLFADPTTFNIPSYYIVVAGDTISGILAQITPTQLEGNAGLPLNAGTALIIPAQTNSVPANSQLSLIQIANALFTTVPNLAAQNPNVLLAAALPDNTLTFTLGGISIPVTSTDTLQTMAGKFNAQNSQLNATAADVAVANQTIYQVFAGQTISYNAYIIQQGNTLTSVANAFTTDVTTLINDNQTTADVFPAGTALYKIGDDQPYQLQLGDTFALVATNHQITIAELASSNTTAALLAVNQSSEDQFLAIPNVVELPAGTYYSSYLTQGTETITNIIQKYQGWDVSGFVTLNQSQPGLFATTQLPGTNVTPKLTDTVATLAAQLNLSPTAFVQQFQTQANILRAGALVLAPALTTPSGATLSGVAQAYNLGSPLSLAQANSAVGGLLQSPQTISYTYTPPQGTPVTKQYSVGANDTLSTVVAQFNSLFNITTLTLDDIVGQNPDIALAANQILLPPPAPALPPALTVTLLNTYPDPIFPLTVEVQMLRDQNRVDPDFQNDTSVFFNSTPVSPSPLSDDGTMSLQSFATNFEKAFSKFKLGTGDAEAAGGGSQPKLWIVNFDPARNGITYSANGSQVEFFALQPLSNQLWSQTDVWVPTYTSGQPLKWTLKQNFQNADLDAWLATLLGAIDQVLSPTYAIPAYQIGANVQAMLDDVLDYKQTIAEGLRDLVDYLLMNQSGDLDAAQEALYQQALTSLSSVYGTTVLLQFPFTVNSPYTVAATAPLLSGKPVAQPYVDDKGKITNSTLVSHTLQTGDTFLSIANQLGIAVTNLVTNNQSVPNVFKPASQVTVLVKGAPVAVTANDGDTLAIIANKIYGAPQVEELAVALWSSDLTGGQGGTGYTLNTNPPSGKPPALTYIESLPVASFTTGKLPLNEGQTTATFLLSVQNPGQSRMAYFNLHYSVNELEYNIQAPPTAVATTVGKDYQESSWLTFIIPLEAVDLGQVQTPIPLRAYPAFPQMSAQAAKADHPGDPDLAKAKQWDYEFDLDSQNAAQDSMELGIFFNRMSDDPPTPPSQIAASAQNKPKLYEALAAFATVYALISKDLTLLLTDPANNNVVPALQAFHDLVERVSTAWQQPTAFAAALGADEDGEIHWYQMNSLINEQASDQYQYLTLSDQEPNPIWPQIYNNLDESGKPLPVIQLPTEALYGYTEPVSQPLDLKFSFDDLDVIRRQNGWSGVSVIRNQNLLGSTAENQQTNPNFVYQTPLTLFSNKITPYVLVDAFAPLTTATGTTMAQALGDFFTVLFNLNASPPPPATQFQIKAACRYAYVLASTSSDLIEALQDDQSLITSIPLVLNPLATFNTATDANPANPQSFVSLLAQAAVAGAAATGASNITGVYLFEVSVYSSLQAPGGQDVLPSKPILDVRNRYWLPPA